MTGGINMNLENRRIIDTFPARHIKEPNGQNPLDSLSEYSLRKGYGLELRRRRRNRKNPIVL